MPQKVALIYAICYTCPMWQKYTSSTPIVEDLYKKVYTLLSDSIPPEERREEAVQRALLKHSVYTLYTYSSQGELFAMLAAWEFPEYRYIEHFAVAEAARGQGIGGKLLQAYLALDARPVLLEVELASASGNAARRIGFYERHGLHLNDIEYDQPPLRKGSPWVPLRLMSWPDALDQHGFEEARLLLYREVYGLSSYGLVEVGKS